MDPNQFSNLAVLVTASVAAAAVISPMITSFFNNRHLLKVKKLELLTLRDKEHREFISRIFENYLSVSGKLIATQDPRFLKDYGEAYGSVLLYLTDSEVTKIHQLDDLIQASRLVGTDKLIREIAEILRERIQTSSKEVK